MSPDRKQTVNGHAVEEFYWAGRWVVYVDGILSAQTFDQACKTLESGDVPLLTTADVY
jgi:hypothetical protein